MPVPSFARAALTALSVVALAGCSHSGDTAGPIEQKPSGFQAGNIVGGATEEVKKDVHPVSGFLPQPDLLTPGPPGRPALVYFNPKANPAAYHKIWLEPIAVWAPPNSDLGSAPAQQQHDLANLFYSDLYDALKTKCTLVKKASPGTIRFRVALVDAKEPNAAVNTLANYTPYLKTAYRVSSKVFNKGVGYFAGTATVEAYATDAADGTLLWEAVDKRGGTTAVVSNTLDSWRDVRHAFQAWGVQMRTRLQEVGICRK